MELDRKSGILLHITSLPGQWGMGELGPAVRYFGDLLEECGQKMWQILPTGPVGYGWSPYSSSSAFAGNPLLISFDELMEEGLLSRRDLSRFPEFDLHRINYPKVIDARMKVLNRIADHFEPDAAFDIFCEREAAWLDDYALFTSIHEAHGNKPWTQWPIGLRDRDPSALDQARKEYVSVIRRHKILQYLFARHWDKTRSFLKKKGIELIGDVPIFVAVDSVDVWANRELFLLNEDGLPTVVAGVPPDYFSETGQRWGNPLYNWKAHRQTDYAWWTRRMRRMLELVDTVRLDHFRAFEACWEIPVDESTAMNGRWVPGPGVELFRTLEKNIQTLPEFGKQYHLAEHVIAENLGVITKEVERLREACGFPGMWVLQFRFGAEQIVVPGYRPEGKEVNWTVYPGTHDNDVTKNWFRQLDENERCRVRKCLKTDGRNIHRQFCELALNAPAVRTILPFQDVLGEGQRMNRPGTVGGNWNWRFSEDMVSSKTIIWLKEASGRAGR
jgi:4-alpha-glucanotransferase